MAKCAVCRGIGILFDPQYHYCTECDGTGGEMDLEWATDTITRFQAILDEAEAKHNGDAMALISGTNDLYDWTEGLHRAAQYLLVSRGGTIADVDKVRT